MNRFILYYSRHKGFYDESFESLRKAISFVDTAENDNWCYSDCIFDTETKTVYITANYDYQTQGLVEPSNKANIEYKEKYLIQYYDFSYTQRYFILQEINGIVDNVKTRQFKTIVEG